MHALQHLAGIASNEQNKITSTSCSFSSEFVFERGSATVLRVHDAPHIIHSPAFSRHSSKIQTGESETFFGFRRVQQRQFTVHNSSA